MRASLAIFALSVLAACDPGASNNPEAVAMRSGPIDYCDIFTCEPCPSTGCPPGGHAVSYCCDIASAGCAEVAAGTVCPEGEYLVICNWGQSNVDGTFTCYDDA